MLMLTFFETVCNCFGEIGSFSSAAVQAAQPNRYHFPLIYDTIDTAMFRQPPALRILSCYSG